MSTKKPKYVNLRQLSALTSIPLSSLRRFAAERRFPLIKINNSRILVDFEEFINWLEKSKIQPKVGGEK